MKGRHAAFVLSAAAAWVVSAVRTVEGQAASSRPPTIDDLVNLASVGSVALSPDGRWVAWVQTAADSKADQCAAARAPQPGRRRTSGARLAVQGVAWHPDGTRIAFAATVNPDLVNASTADLYVVHLAAARCAP